MHPLIFREILSVTMILFAIIDILGAVPIIIELRQRGRAYPVGKGQPCRDGFNDRLLIWRGRSC